MSAPRIHMVGKDKNIPCQCASCSRRQAEYNVGFADGQDIQAQTAKDLRNEVEALRKYLHRVRFAPTLADAVNWANVALLPRAAEDRDKIGRGLLHD